MLLDHSTIRLGTASRALQEPQSTARRPRLRAGLAPWAGRYSRVLTAFENKGLRVGRDIRDLTYEDWTKNATDRASKDGVTGTPTVLVNGKALANATTATPADITAAVQAAAGS